MTQSELVYITYSDYLAKYPELSIENDLLEENYPWYFATALATVCNAFGMVVTWPWIF